MEFLETCIALLSKYGSFFLDGVQNTLILSFFSVLLGSLAGTVMGMMRMSKSPLLRWPASAYIEFIRGTPLMIQIMFLWYGLPELGITFPEIFGIDGSDRMFAGIIAVAINSCAYVAEIVRAGIQAVDKGQMEAARAMGFSHTKSMILVVLPQAIKNILPAIGNEFITVIKETSVVSVIGIADLTFRAGDVRSITWRNLETLAIAAVIYFILTFTTSKLVGKAERRMNYDKR